MSVEVEPNEIEVTANADIEVSRSEIEPCVVNDAIEVLTERKEYMITGDTLYASVSSSEAPAWLTNIIDTTVDSITSTKLASLDEAISSITTSIAEIEALKNQYAELINIASNPDEVTISRLETLDSTVTDNNALIVDLQTTTATKDYAATISAEVLDASINDGDINSIVTNLNTAISNGDSTNATSINALSSTFSGAISGQADAIQSMQTYVGINGAGASTSEGLSAYLEDSEGNIGGGNSQVANSIYTDGGITKSKWEYDSNIVIDGVSYDSGFGIHTDNGASEFWINAEKFKFTNSGVTGQVAPFSIDASGTTPQVTFNGVVSFENTSMDAYDNSNIDTSSLALKDMSNVTTIDGGKITTGKIQSANGNTYFDLANNQIKMNNGSFILDSTAVGTSTYPNIKGGYIKGATIDGGSISGITFNVRDIVLKAESYPLSTGAIGNTISSGYFIGQNYNSGSYDASRICSDSSIINISGSFLLTYVGIQSGTGVLAEMKGYLQYTLDDGETWITLDSGHYRNYVWTNASEQVSGAVKMYFIGVIQGSTVGATQRIGFRITYGSSYGSNSVTDIKYVANLVNK